MKKEILPTETLYLTEWRNVRKWDTKHRTAAESRNPLQVQNKSLSSSSQISSRSLPYLSSTCTWYGTVVLLRSLPETSLVGSRTSLLSRCIALAAAIAIWIPDFWDVEEEPVTTKWRFFQDFLKIRPWGWLALWQAKFLASKRWWWWKPSVACVSSPPTRASMWNPSRSTNFC